MNCAHKLQDIKQQKSSCTNL